MQTSRTNIRKAAIYARQSINNLDGIDTQIKNCERLCKQRGWEISKVYQDNETSASKKRGKGTDWWQMLEDIDGEQFDVVVAVNLDRLLRGLSDLTALIERGALILTVDGEIDLTSAEGEFQATLLAALARFEMNRKSERQLRANKAKVERGIPVPTRRRFGYETDGCTPRQEEARFVVEIFDRFTSGHSIRSIAMDLRDRNVSVGGGKSWSTGRVREILRRPFYKGSVYHLGTVVDSDFVKPIVSKETFATAAAILNDPSRKSNRGITAIHLLTGIAECGVCGEKLHRTTGYKCKAATNHVFINSVTLENAVLLAIGEWMLVNREKTWSRIDSAEYRELISESAQLSVAVASNTQLLTENFVDRDVVVKKLKALSRRKAEIEEKISAVLSRDSRHNAIETIRAFLNEEVNWEAEYEKLNLETHPELATSTPKDAIDDNYFRLLAQDRLLETRWREAWSKIAFDEQRELIKSLFRIRVNKGRGISRVEITSTIEAE